MLAYVGPSGTGKTSAKNAVIAVYPDTFGFSVSSTTRNPRGAEKDGVDYFFLTVEKFKEKKEAGLFAESEEVYKDRWYGTLKSEIERIQDEGLIPIFDIDVKGARQLKELYGDAFFGCMIVPGSAQEHIKKLRARNTESEEELQERIARFEYELSVKDEFDCCIVNDYTDAFFETVINVTQEALQLPEPVVK